RGLSRERAQERSDREGEESRETDARRMIGPLVYHRQHLDFSRLLRSISSRRAPPSKRYKRSGYTLVDWVKQKSDGAATSYKTLGMEIRRRGAAGCSAGGRATGPSRVSR